MIPDLGLGYLAAATCKQEFSVRILDWNTTFNRNEFVLFLRQQIPKVIGMKIFTVNVTGAVQTIKIIKRALPEAIILIGGPHPSTSDPDVLFDEFPEIDFAFQGEVEHSLPAFLKLLKSIDFDRQRFNEIASQYSTIEGLVWRENQTTRHIPATLQDIQTIPMPAWNLIDPNRYNTIPLLQGDTVNNPHVAPIITTRGCPFPCSFCCAYHINGKYVRRRNVKDVADEIDMLHTQYGIRQFYLMDNSFSLDRDYILAFCDEIIRRRLSIAWDCIYEILANYDTATTEHLLGKMAEAGCVCIILGIETASGKVMKVSKKIYDTGNVSDIIRAAHKVHINVQGFFMFGFPQETADDVKETIDFALAQHFDLLHFTHLLPLPGTEIYRDLQQQHQFRRLDWNNYTPKNPPYQMGALSSSALNRQIALANFKAHYHTTPGIKKLLARRPIFSLLSYLRYLR